MRKKRLVKPYKSARSIKPKYKINPKEELFYLALCIGVFFALILSAINLGKTFAKPEPQKEVLAQTRDINHEREFWHQILNETPDYLPGILEMVKIEYELGNTNTSYELLEQAKSINPNDERVKGAISSFLRSSPFVR